MALAAAVRGPGEEKAFTPVHVPGWARGSWNPLVCDGTALRPNVLLSGKLLALWLLVHRGPLWRPRVHLPFLEVLDRLGPAAPVLQGAMTAAFLLFTAALLLNRVPRTSCFALGGMVLLAIAMNRTNFSNNSTFAGCFLLLLGLHEPGRPPVLLRWQIVIVYFGAGLNKLLDVDWRSGVFFEYWTHEVLALGTYMDLAALLPPLALSVATSWLVILLELGLAAGFAWPRSVPWAIGVGLFFHVGMLVFTGGEISWLFLYVMGAAFVAVAPWPTDDTAEDRRGARGLGVRLLTRPATYAVVATLLLWEPLPGFMRRTVALLTG